MNTFYSLCIALFVLSSIGTSQTQEMNDKCAPIKGKFLFLGEWIELNETSSSGPVKISIRNSEPQPRLDRSAGLRMSIIDDPKFVRISLDGNLAQIKSSSFAAYDFI